MTSGLGGAPRSVVAFIEDRVAAWRQGTRAGQRAAFGLLGFVALLLMAVALLTPVALPVAVFAVPLVVGGVTLRLRPLGALVIFVAMCAGASIVLGEREPSSLVEQGINVLVLTLVSAVVLFVASRDRSGLPGPLGKAMLMELNERLRVQGVVPPLPAGWQADSELRSSGGAQFAGDFFIAHLDDAMQTLEVVVVDVSGKGVGAGTKSLQFAGALGGLIGTMPPTELFLAANDFLLRQGWDFSFATAVDLRIDLGTGEFVVTSAGHPPALRWNKLWSSWDLDKARGTALGMVKDVQFERSKGRIEPGEAVMLYTDGVVESREHDLDAGIDLLRAAATQAVRVGWDGIASRIVESVRDEDDDRAVLVVHREG